MVSARFNRRWFCTGLAAVAAGTAIGAIGQGIPQALAKAKAALAEPDGVIYPGKIGQIQIYTAKAEDSLVDLARTFKLGFTELAAANPGIDPWIPGEGTKILLPTGHLLPDAPRKGMVLNLVDQRLYYFRTDGVVESFAIGTGRDAWDTPLGATKVVRKKRNPYWYVPKSIRAEDPELPKVVPPGPKNPLGKFAMYLGWPGYLIHGTNNPWGVGRRVSHGCIRMYPEDIKHLFPRIPVGTPVTVVSQEIKIVRFGDQLLLEIHSSPSQTDEIEAKGKFTPGELPELPYRIASVAGDDVNRIDWGLAKRTSRERRGVPVNILRPRAEAAASGI